MLCRDVAASANWIDSDEGLAAAAAEWPRIIGLDTEFQRTDTFFPLPGLYQVAAAGKVYLLDPLEIADFAPLLETLEDRRVTKIMHACSEDLELLRHHFGAVPVGLFDTQLANAFVSPDYSVSFSRLVHEKLGVELDQQETRSDWLARPLDPDQVRYACEDVYFLEPLYRLLFEALERDGRTAWFREEMDLRGRFELGDPDAYYLNMKRAWRLAGPVRARLKELAAWRERQAMAEDRPRNRVVRDEHLLALAALEAVEPEDISDLLPRPAARRYGDELMAAHQRGSDCDDVPPSGEAPLASSHNGLVRDLRELGAARAEALGMAPELLARKREVETCVRHFVATGELSPAFSGWRSEVVGQVFRERLERR